VQNLRQHLVPLARGKVLEIGVGPGVNFVHCDPARVSKVYALEPNPGMIPRAEQQGRRTELDIEFLDLPGERIPLADARVDTVVSTFTLCTIPGVVEAIRGIGRVVKPDRQFIFFEHRLAPDARVRRWQERTEPLFKMAMRNRAIYPTQTATLFISFTNGKPLWAFWRLEKSRASPTFPCPIRSWKCSSVPFDANVWIIRCSGRVQICKINCWISGPITTSIAPIKHGKGERRKCPRHNPSLIWTRFAGKLTVEVYTRHRWLPDFSKGRSCCDIQANVGKDSD
jgi:SAM-dependent methyltransferase